ncbi:MAG: DUF72 domain-containing protein [Acidobacteria bacterium]|nr:DUF72 domain-containing protein [Acidobacteriota bacterium]
MEGWVEKTPANFIFSLKVPREITHDFSLRPGSYTVMEEFVATAKLLGEKLGVILIQLPASFESDKINAQNLRDFLVELPTDLRFAIEFRHPGWFVEWTFEEFSARGIAIALVEGKWIENEAMFRAAAATKTDFAYVRIMGERDLDKFDRLARPRDPELQTWAREIGTLAANNIFVYIDNFFEGHAPATARKLQAMLGLPPTSPETLQEQPSLF